MNDAKWVVGILGAIDGQTPHPAALAVVYAVQAALTAEIEHQERLADLKDVAAALGLPTSVETRGDRVVAPAGQREILAEIGKLKTKSSRAHSKAVVDGWSKVATVANSEGKRYEVKKRNNVLMCTCMAWRFSKASPKRCKHTDAVRKAEKR